MKSDVETLSPTRVRLSVEVPFEDLKPSIDEAYRRIGAQVQIPGFRKGRVPTSLIDQRFGREAVLNEAVNEALPKAYGDAVREHEVLVLGQPDVEVTEFADGDDLKFTAEVDVRPSIELPAFETIAVEVADVEVSDEQVEEQLTELAARFGSLQTVERPAQVGDFVTIDLAATRDGEELEDATASGLSYEVGGQQILDGLDDAITGLSAGESSTWSTPLLGGEAAGEEADVTVTVSAVKERSLPPIDDDFAQLASEFDTLAELRDDLRERLGRVRLLEQGIEARDKLLDRLLEIIEPPLPETLVTAQLDEHFQDGHGDEAHRSEFEAEVRKRLAVQFVLDEVARQEELSANQEELTQYLVEQAPRYGMSPDQFAQALVEADQVPMAVGEVVRSKALAVVLRSVAVTDASGRPVDLSDLDDADEDVIDVLPSDHDHHEHEHEHDHDHEH